MLKLNRTFIFFSGSLIGLISILLLFPADVSINIRAHEVASDKSSVLIGNLGGYPVNLPDKMVHFVEYHDSSGFDSDKTYNHNPTKRNYNSIIESFGYYVRYSNGEIMDSTRYSKEQFSQEERDHTQKWISIGIESGSRYRKNGYLDIFLKNEIDTTGKFQYFYLPEKYFGLDIYAQTNIDPNTGRPFRETDHILSQDIFIHRKNGHIETYIKCLNQAKGIRFCEHFFYMDEDMEVNFRVMYPRDNLGDWRTIEEVVKNSIWLFRV